MKFDVQGVDTEVMRQSAKPRTARPFLVLSVALILQLCAGTVYWWPALAPGLKHNLHLTNGQVTAIVVAANSGSSLGILGGIFHERAGSRAAAVTGSLGITLCYATLAFLVKYAPPAESSALSFIFCMISALSTALFSYMVFSTSITAAASLFPRAFRGRVVGLCSSMYGASAAVAGSIQSGFFPSLDDTGALLICTTAFSLLATMLALASYPDKETYRVHPCLDDSSHSYNTLPSTPFSSLHTPNRIVPHQEIASHVEVRLQSAYRSAWFLVGLLQVCVVAGLLEMPRFIRSSCAVAVITVVISYALMPLRSTLIVEEEIVPEAHRYEEVEPSFVSVASDVRYMYICLGFLVLVGSGIAMLVQAPHIVESSFLSREDGRNSLYDPEQMNRLVRVLVVVFGTFNLISRLGIGTIMDWGSSGVEQLMWKYDLMHADSLLMGLALLALAVLPLTGIYFAAALVGLSYGTWMATASALATLWFGVRSFPRNFAIPGIFVSLASVTLASTLPSILRSMFGEWIDVKIAGGAPNEFEHVCIGICCSGALLCLLAALQFLMYGFGLMMRATVKEGAEVLFF